MEVSKKKSKKRLVMVVLSQDAKDCVITYGVQKNYRQRTELAAVLVFFNVQLRAAAD
jgi:hypothetical protein